jgi:predicted  nucleic acid-binding Zn-ribbon protein
MRIGNKLVSSVFLAALASFGFAMPSCPGQQETKDQVAALQQANDALTRRVQDLETQFKPIAENMEKITQSLRPMLETIETQRKTMDLLNSNMKEILDKMSRPGASASSKGKPAAKRRR